MNNKHKYYKSYLKLNTAYKNVLSEYWNLPLVKLENPIHDGWNITIQFREDIYQRKEIESFKAALKIGFEKEFFTRNVAYENW